MSVHHLVVNIFKIHPAKLATFKEKFKLFLAAWAPALRDGSLWREFLKFNLGGTARITGILIKSPALLNSINYRVVSKVLIEASNNCDNFVPVYDSGIPVDGVVRFAKTVIASNVKITITGLDSSDNADASPIAINK